MLLRTDGSCLNKMGRRSSLTSNLYMRRGSMQLLHDTCLVGRRQLLCLALLFVKVLLPVNLDNLVQADIGTGRDVARATVLEDPVTWSALRSRQWHLVLCEAEKQGWEARCQWQAVRHTKQSMASNAKRTTSSCLSPDLKPRELSISCNSSCDLSMRENGRNAIGMVVLREVGYGRGGKQIRGRKTSPSTVKLRNKTLGLITYSGYFIS